MEEIDAGAICMGTRGRDGIRRLPVGEPGDRLRSLADEEDVDLVVTATHGRSGPARLVLGSTAEFLVRRAPCPVLTLSEPPPERR